MKQNRPNAARPFAGNLLPGVNPQDLKEVVCNCEGKIFAPAFMVRFASPLQTANSQPTMVQFPIGHVCLKCHKINDFKKDIKKEVQDDSEVPEPQSGGDLGVSVSESVKSKEALN